VHESKLMGKSHVIPKQLLWDAWLKVKDNGGAAGADGVSIEQFGEDLKGNLYRLWNRMSSGSYFPGPVRAVEIPKKGGIRVLGIPNVVDRVAQTAAAMALEPSVEPVFHEDSYAYRPGRAPVDAVGERRSRAAARKARSPGSGSTVSPSDGYRNPASFTPGPTGDLTPEPEGGAQCVDAHAGI